MKVIKEPKASEWHYNFTCKKCTAELEAEAVDVRYCSYESDGCYPSSETYAIACPICHEDHFVDKKNLPAIVALEAENRCRRFSSACQWDH